MSPFHHYGRKRKADQFTLLLCLEIGSQRFDNRATLAERRATDKLAAFRDFWTLFQA